MYFDVLVLLVEQSFLELQRRLLIVKFHVPTATLHSLLCDCLHLQSQKLLITLFTLDLTSFEIRHDLLCLLCLAFS